MSNLNCYSKELQNSRSHFKKRVAIDTIGGGGGGGEGSGDGERDNLELF